MACIMRAAILSLVPAAAAAYRSQRRVPRQERLFMSTKSPSYEDVLRKVQEVNTGKFNEAVNAIRVDPALLKECSKELLRAVKKKADKTQGVGGDTMKRQYTDPSAVFVHTRQTDDCLREFMRNKPDNRNLMGYFLEDFAALAAGSGFANMLTWEAAYTRWYKVLVGEDPESIVYFNNRGYTQEQRERIAAFCATVDGPEDPALWQWIVDNFPGKLSKDSRRSHTTPRYQARHVLRYIKDAHKRNELFWRFELSDQPSRSSTNRP